MPRNTVGQRLDQIVSDLQGRIKDLDKLGLDAEVEQSVELAALEQRLQGKLELIVLQLEFLTVTSVVPFRDEELLDTNRQILGRTAEALGVDLHDSMWEQAREFIRTGCAPAEELVG